MKDTTTNDTNDTNEELGDQAGLRSEGLSRHPRAVGSLAHASGWDIFPTRERLHARRLGEMQDASGEASCGENRGLTPCG